MKKLRRRKIAKAYKLKYSCIKGESVLKVKNITSYYGFRLNDEQFLRKVKFKSRMINKKDKKHTI